MHDHRPRRLILGLLALSSSVTFPPPIARDQVFFVGEGPSPVLLALVFQRAPNGAGTTSVEVKSFLVWEGRFETPFYAQRDVPTWPGSDLTSAATSDGDLRLSVTEQPLRIEARRPSGALILEAPALTPAGSGDDPHGQVTWTSGRGTLRVNGRTVHGTVLWERLTRPRPAWPRFGQFEMWLATEPNGGLVLGRHHVGEPGVAVHVPRSGPPRIEAFGPEVARAVPDAETSFPLPLGWRNGPSHLERIAGALGRGQAPGGGPAVYDVAFARGEGVAALVFHLVDSE